ncbi:MAG: hypothetical protein A3I44_04960 [Candidatus Sungbacteria bacterium RIFCSPLOWO2_02_FULL_51_17]|uniref:Type II secretion system protein GspF domain-containing protein n=1 Tax=Candidatus Sungbacteria bacterium RIFCSPHIGHO2_02_FULL_51_29 TaxID=1802273 RepID=A0A1G2KY39_9BACT|nr:MAG: hypothetical protein A2676_03785 [Candidatus Sungbacteria bacterium RIFCSPHIGHO2_01_FULL_51_22]OHA03392.1 MAG: hypothetical protein A3C16_05700 [Candidatus Sungbacteria bacterium RIFCSPHIGHO2_02_FULL_51_29]OHA05262.1 MAG: hypothetical protein A3B29_00185 [Candidatus Sungbacteria bacterium RIFCSPLOWO2_01_FULL_51_34]OHA11690.1 MAG: hypothetical protein A3I44_04960 [Candidatus Sungbacteria bacterium RIFCSPLOWO2_02_FULL_51_17]
MEFIYKARTPEGEERQGSIEALNLENAVDSLQRSGLIVVELRPHDTGGVFGARMRFFEHVKQRDLVIFSRQLATLFEAKVPIVQSLKTLMSEAPSPILREAISEIMDDLSGGSSLSQAMMKHPNIFGAFYVNMIKAGEESGKLKEVFTFLADNLERTHELVSKVKNALIYPAFVLTAFVGVMVVMMVVVVPRLVGIFEEASVPIPFYTQIIISLSLFLRDYGIFLLIALIAGSAIGWRYIGSEKGRQLFDEIRIRLPFVGGLSRKMYLSTMADNLANLIAAGVPILRALQITADVVGNRVYRTVILDAVEAVKAGNSMSLAFEKYEEIPPLVTQMIHIGEESGKLDFVLEALSRFYRREVLAAVEALIGLIEPMLILVLGGGVGILVAAILVPLYSLSSAL